MVSEYQALKTILMKKKKINKSINSKKLSLQQNGNFLDTAMTWDRDKLQVTGITLMAWHIYKHTLICNV